MPDLDFPTKAGGTLRGYLSTPIGPGPWPGVVVLHELFGLTDDIRTVTDRIAGEGYLAFAPDLYSWGVTARCLVATMRAMLSGSGRAFDDIDAAREFLVARGDCTDKVGVIGFCMGGGFAVLCTTRGFDVSAPNYGVVPKDAETVLRGACPAVASYGAKDRQLRSHSPRLDAALTALGVDHDVKEYADAGHGFLFPHSGASAKMAPVFGVHYTPGSADDAWKRIFSWFDRYLKASA